MKQKLTEQQQKIYDYIESEIKEKGIPPTIREIQEAFSFSSTNSVTGHLERIKQKGYITATGGISRGLKLTDRTGESNLPDSTVLIPIIGRVAAGSQIWSAGLSEGELRVDKSITGSSKNCFALKVRGESMINAGIFEDDIIIVDKDARYSNYDIVVVLIDGDATVKRYVRKGNEIHLLPENDRFETIVVNSNNEVTIPGKVIGLIRKIN
ncbi:MAG: transcriptional repressor LexA [Ignavibacteriaceae bacterium]|nr:transcriptional repressor LexA [Ignavibacteriaceae bacterium]